MKSIAISNFRCFRELNTIPLRTGINLFIGDNASGKTSFLRACRYALSAFFAGFSDENTRWITPGYSDFNHVTSKSLGLPFSPISIDFSVSDIFPDLGQDSIFSIQKNSPKNSRALTSGIARYKSFAVDILRSYFDKSGNQVKALPVFASYETEDIHKTKKISEKKFRSYVQKPSFGYYECFNESGMFAYWIKRLLVLQEAGKGEQEIESVKRAVLSALGPGACDIIKDMQIRPLSKKVVFVDSHDREIYDDELPDGYKRLLSIVIDLAFRCSILNRGIYGDEAAKISAGTVLIDEVDLHLHPSLQKVALKALQTAFPKMQIIATTHAPLVMASLEDKPENAIFKMACVGLDYHIDMVPSPYGMDMSLVTSALLNVEARPKDVEGELTELFDKIDAEDPEAKALLKKLQDKYGDKLPELARAETLLTLDKV